MKMRTKHWKKTLEESIDDVVSDNANNKSINKVKIEEYTKDDSSIYSSIDVLMLEEIQHHYSFSNKEIALLHDRIELLEYQHLSKLQQLEQHMQKKAILIEEVKDFKKKEKNLKKERKQLEGE